jgi:hypothetical protein
MWTTKRVIAADAAERGYSDPDDYMTDSNYTECTKCDRVGEIGQEMFPTGSENELWDGGWICIKCRPLKERG